MIASVETTRLALTRSRARSDRCLDPPRSTGVPLRSTTSVPSSPYSMVDLPGNLIGYAPRHELVGVILTHSPAVAGSEVHATRFGPDLEGGDVAEADGSVQLASHRRRVQQTQLVAGCASHTQRMPGERSRQSSAPPTF